MQKKLCATCELKLTPAENVEVGAEGVQGSIWEFPFLKYENFHEMWCEFNEFYRKFLLNGHSDRDFWCLHNKEGYTFTQWQVFYVSKKIHRYRDLRRAVFTLFNVLCKFSFWNELLRLGTRSDSRHHTIHHYLVHMESGMNAFQKKMFDFLNNYMTSEEIELKDNNNCSIIDYYNQILIPEAVQKLCAELTEQYKRTEKEFFDQLPFMIRCEMCSACIQPYEDLVQYHTELYQLLDEQPDWSDRLEEMLTQRERCNRMYAECTTRVLDERCVRRHDYVLDVYRKLFEW